MYELFCLEVDLDEKIIDQQHYSCLCGFIDACVPVEDWISFSMLYTKLYLCIEKRKKKPFIVYAK